MVTDRANITIDIDYKVEYGFLIIVSKFNIGLF